MNGLNVKIRFTGSFDKNRWQNFIRLGNMALCSRLDPYMEEQIGKRFSADRSAPYLWREPFQNLTSQAVAYHFYPFVSDSVYTMDRIFRQIRWISHHVGPHIQCHRRRNFRWYDVYVIPATGAFFVVDPAVGLHSMVDVSNISSKRARYVSGVPS